MSGRVTKTSTAKDAWRKVLEGRPVLPGEPVVVTAAELTEHGREARLAAKNDNPAALPKYLAERGLMVIPCGRNLYAVTGDVGYVGLEQPESVTILAADPWDIYTAGLGHGESSHLRYAHHHKLVHRVAGLDPDADLSEIGSGRRMGGDVDFTIGGASSAEVKGSRVPFTIKGMQLETDGQFLSRQARAGVSVEVKGSKCAYAHPRQVAFPHWDFAATAPQGTSLTSVFMAAAGVGDYTFHTIGGLVPEAGQNLPDVANLVATAGERILLDPSSQVPELVLPAPTFWPRAVGMVGDVRAAAGNGGVGRSASVRRELESLGLSDADGRPTAAGEAVAASGDTDEALAGHLAGLAVMRAYAQAGVNAARMLVGTRLSRSRADVTMAAISEWHGWLQTRA